MERREHRRFSVQVSVEVTGDGVAIAATMGNVSEGGAFLRLARRPRQGARITVLIPRADAQQVAVCAIVCRVALNGVGIAWDASDKEQQRVVDELVTEAEQPAGQVR